MRLAVILLNPPPHPQGSRTITNVEAAARVMNADVLETVNIVNLTTKDLPELNRVGGESDPWVEARLQLRETVARADTLLAAWGLGGFSGRTRVNFEQQREYLTDLIDDRHVGGVWTLGGRPRHPSRWRQFLGPQKARVEGADFEERLCRSLLRTDIGTLLT